MPISFTAAYTSSGATCLAVAGMRPRSPIRGLSPSLSTARMLSLVWGVHSVHIEDVTSVEGIAYHRVLKVARTTADLAGTQRISSANLAEAIQ